MLCDVNKYARFVAVCSY